MGMRYRAPFGVMHNSALTCTRAVCSESGYFAGNGQSVRPSVRQPLKGSRNFLRSHGNGRNGGRPSLDSLSLSRDSFMSPFASHTFSHTHSQPLM